MLLKLEYEDENNFAYVNNEGKEYGISAHNEEGYSGYFYYVLDGEANKRLNQHEDTVIIHKYFRGVIQGSVYYINLIDKGRGEHYWLNGIERVQADDYKQRYQDVINEFYNGDYRDFEDELMNKQIDTKIIRKYRILEGMRMEWKYNNYGSRTPILDTVLSNLAKNPGKYDRITYEQLKPDYYHVLDMNRQLWEDEDIPSIYIDWEKAQREYHAQ